MNLGIWWPFKSLHVDYRIFTLPQYERAAMDRNFARCLDIVLKYEGGFSNHKDDPGGPTNLGITLATFRRFVKPNGTVEDLKKLTKAQAAICYRRQYWDAVHGAELPDGVDLATFDFAVNSGPGRAAKYLQAVLGVAQDGKIGPATVAAARSAGQASTIHSLCDKRMEFLKRLPTWPTFGKGWTKRVGGVRLHALSMLAPAASPFDWPEEKAGAPIPRPVEKGKRASIVDLFLTLFRWWR